MAELQSWCEPIDEVEAMVRAASDYVHPSDDLRPRVLETARVVCREQRAQRRVRQMALVFVLLAVFAPTSRGPVVAVGDHPGNSLSVGGTASLFSRIESAGNRGCDDFGWGLVEAFTKLRRQQAEALRPGHGRGGGF